MVVAAGQFFPGFNFTRIPLATASAVNASFSASDPSHQKILSGWQSFACASTQRMTDSFSVF